MHQLSFIRWSHDHHVGKASHLCNIKCSMMCWSISTNQASSHDKSHRNCENMQQKGETFCSQTSCKCNSVQLSLCRSSALEITQTYPTIHGYYLIVGFHFLY